MITGITFATAMRVRLETELGSWGSQHKERDQTIPKSVFDLGLGKGGYEIIRASDGEQTPERLGN